MSTQTRSALESLEHEVKCPVCMEIFDAPKKLPCDHVVCSQCIDSITSMSRDSTLACPMCRAAAPLTDAGQFPIAYQVIRLKDIYHQTIQEQTRATPPASATSKPPHLPLCSLHTCQPLALYCETCEKEICRDCALISCATNKHKYGYLQQVATEYKSNLDKEIPPLSKLHRVLSEQLITLTQDLETLEEQRKKEQIEAEQAFQLYFNKLRQERVRIVKTIEEKYKEHTSDYKAKIEVLVDTISEIDSSIQSAGNLTLEDDLASKIGQMDLLKRQLFDLHQEFVSLSPKVMSLADCRANIKFIPEDANKFSFYVGKNYKCQLSEYSKLQSLKIYQPFTIDFHLNNWNEPKVTATITSLVDNSLTTTSVTKPSPHCIKLSFTPQKRGRHILQFHLPNKTTLFSSPLELFVVVDPDKISSLGKPKQTAIPEAAGIKCCNNRVYVTSAGEVVVMEHRKRILGIDGRVPLPCVGEIMIWERHIYNTNKADDRLEKVTMNGHIVASTGGRGSQPGLFNSPKGIRISSKNEIYICDSSNHRIQIFDTDLKLLRIIGNQGTNCGQFQSPYDFVFDDSENMYVVEYGNNRIQVLTKYGVHIRFIGTHDNHQLCQPVSAAIYNKHIYVTNSGNNCLSVFTLTGEFVVSFGKKAECIDIDTDGYIYTTCDRKYVLRY